MEILSIAARDAPSRRAGSEWLAFCDRGAAGQVQDRQTLRFSKQQHSHEIAT